jgi:hypothetical protein
VREVVEMQQRRHGFIQGAHFDDRHLVVLLQVVKSLHIAVLGKQIDQCILVALQLHGDARDVERCAGRDNLRQVSTTVAVERRGRKLARVFHFKAVGIATWHGHSRMLGKVDTKLLAVDDDPVEVVKCTCRLVE